MRREGWLALWAVMLGACGPIEYVNHVTTGATPAIEAARSADAAKWSPYWWTLAIEYRHKAKEEAAYAHFEAANRFGALAEEAAGKAREEALRRSADPAAAAKEMGPVDGGTITPDKAPTTPARTPKAGLAPTEDKP